MTVTEFESYLKKGLGRAILLLKQEPDKTPLREVAIKYLAEGYNMEYRYDLDLLSCFEDSEEMTRDVVSQCLARAEAFESPHNLHLLAKLGYHKEYILCMKRHYESASQKILTEDNVDIDTRNRFIVATVYILDNTEITKEQVRNMFPPLIAYFSFFEERDIPTSMAGFIRRLIEHLWDNDTESLLSEISSLPGGNILAKLMRDTDTTPPNPSITTREILDSLPFTQPSFGTRASICFASPKVVEEIAEIILTSSDDSVRSDLLTLFYHGYSIDGVIKNPPAFPFPERLITAVANEIRFLSDPLDDAKRLYIHHALTVLSKSHDPQLVSLGKLLRNTQITAFKGTGWSIMGNNYTSDDRDELITALTTESTDIEKGNGIFYSALGALLRAAELGSSGLPLDLLPSFWADVPHEGWRKRIAEILVKYNMMPEDIIEECRCDRGEIVRKLVEEL